MFIYLRIRTQRNGMAGREKRQKGPEGKKNRRFETFGSKQRPIDPPRLLGSKVLLDHSIISATNYGRTFQIKGS